MGGIAALFTQTVQVQTYNGADSFGPSFADEVDVACYVNDGWQLVRDASGQEVTSATTLYAPLGDIDKFTPDSKVTVNGRPARVLRAARRDSAGPARVHHAQITLI